MNALSSFFAGLRRFAVIAVQLLVVAGLLASSVATQASSIQHLMVQCEALGRNLPVSVYLPEGEAPKAGWPVLYLLHGLGGSERDWLELGALRSTMDGMIAAGRIRPMVVVMPGAGSSWYVDSAGIGGPGNYETAILDDLPKAIEARYPVERSRTGRAIAGVSMGGFGALRLAFRHPERFVAVASMSGALWQNIPAPEPADAKPTVALVAEGGGYFDRLDTATVIPRVDVPDAIPRFGNAFGSPFDPVRFNSENVFTLLAKRVAAHTVLPSIFLTVGDHDAHKLWRGSIALYETLKADNENVEFRVTDGDHIWGTWKKSIIDTLSFVSDQFGGSNAGGVEADRSLAG